MNGMTEPIFVGREAQLARMQKTLERTLAGQAQVVFIKPWVSRYPTSPIRQWFWKDVAIEPH
jgi:hypothetical protein